MTRVWLSVLLILLAAQSAAAQVITNPNHWSFTQPAADVPVTVSVHLEFFQCASVTTPTPGICNGQAAQPFATTVDVAAASISSGTADANGNVPRTFILTGAQMAMPVGVPFIATAVAVGDPLQGLGSSPRSAASNPFFGGVRPLAAPATLRTAP